MIYPCHPEGRKVFQGYRKFEKNFDYVMVRHEGETPAL
jgi:hypothetical protein